MLVLRDFSQTDKQNYIQTNKDLYDIYGYPTVEMYSATLRSLTIKFPVSIYSWQTTVKIRLLLCFHEWIEIGNDTNARVACFQLWRIRLCAMEYWQSTESDYIAIVEHSQRYTASYVHSVKLHLINV